MSKVYHITTLPSLGFETTSDAVWQGSKEPSYHFQQVEVPLEPEKGKLHLTRRGKLALKIGGALMAAAVSVPAGVVVAEGIANTQRASSEYDTFSQYHLGEHLADSNIDPSKVMAYTIQPGDAPRSIATKLHATKDAYSSVVDEISSQEGNERSLQAGDTVIIPLDQLDRESH